MSTNVVPNHITVGTDLRCKTLEYMPEVARKLDRAAQGSAYALEGEVTIETELGYLPFVQDRYLNSFVERTFAKFDKIPDIIDDRGGIAAAGDIGDLAFMMPCIQISYGGFEGTIHGDDFKMIDPEFVLETFPEFLSEVLMEMSGNLDEEKIYRRSFKEYKELIDSIGGMYEEAISVVSWFCGGGGNDRRIDRDAIHYVRNTTVTVLPLVFSVLLAMLFGLPVLRKGLVAKIYSKGNIQFSAKYLLYIMPPLMARYGADVAPRLKEILSVGWVFLFQELGNVERFLLVCQ